MSCFDELTYAIYADGELAGPRRREVETHLIGCRRCRELVVQLGDEAQLLGEALHERRRRKPVVAAPAPARGVAIGIGPVLLGVALATSALGWLVETAAPTGNRWLGPLSPKGAYDMLFDVIFLLRDEAPDALAFVTAVAVMASASALLTFLLTSLLRRLPRRNVLSLALLVAVGALPDAGRAHFGLHDHEDFELAAGEEHAGTLFVSGETANINGVVDGDLLVFAHTLTLRGEVKGNVLAIARQYEQTGEVDGSAHVAALRAHVDGEVDGNLYVVGESLSLSRDARIGGDTALAGERMVVEGSIGRDLYATGERMELRGEVDRNVDVHSRRLALLDGARVRGDLSATLPEGREIEIASGAVVEGETGSRLAEHDPPAISAWRRPMHYGVLVLHVAAGFAAAMLLRALFPAVFAARIATAGEFFRTLGLGFVVMVATPVALVLLGLTLVGLPLSLIGGAGYLTGLYVGLLLVAFLVGSSLLHPDETWWSFGLTLLAGLAVLALLVHLPVVGPWLRVLAAMLGIGLLADHCRNLWERRAQPAPLG